MALRFKAPRGTQDILPGESHRWQNLEQDFRGLAESYGYQELRTPAFEATELFVRSSGDTSEVVNKQMYTFLDKGDRSMSLKPEGTAPAVRAYLEGSLGQPGQITRLWYTTQIFRYERPQKGRYRQGHQVGIELLGSGSPDADAEVIELTAAFYRKIGLRDLVVKLNCIGRAKTRADYRAALMDHLSGWLADQDAETKERAEKNPLRLLDSKDPAVQEAVREAPAIRHYLEPESRESFEKLQALLGQANLAFEIDDSIVRGLDYYTDTVFEVQSAGLGSQNALCGGGRYDNLVSDLGGPPTPAVGVAMGIERALIALPEDPPHWQASRPRAFVVAANEQANDKVRQLVRGLRESGIPAVYDLEFRGLRNQLKQADRSGAEFAILIGEEELESGKASVKRLREEGTQLSVPFEDLAKALVP